MNAQPNPSSFVSQELSASSIQHRHAVLGLCQNGERTPWRAEKINKVKFGRRSPTCRWSPRWGEKEKRKRKDGTEEKRALTSLHPEPGQRNEECTEERQDSVAETQEHAIGFSLWCSLILSVLFNHHLSGALAVCLVSGQALYTHHTPPHNNLEVRTILISILQMRKVSHEVW